MKRIFRIFNKKPQSNICKHCVKTQGSKSKGNPKRDNCYCSDRKDVRSRSVGRDKYHSSKQSQLYIASSDTSTADLQKKKRPKSGKSRNDYTQCKKECKAYRQRKMISAGSSESCLASHSKQQSCYQLAMVKNPCRSQRSATNCEASAVWIPSKERYSCTKTASTTSLPGARKYSEPNTYQCNCAYQTVKTPAKKTKTPPPTTAKSSHLIDKNKYVEKSRHSGWCCQRKRDLKENSQIVNQMTVAKQNPSCKPRAGILKNKTAPDHVGNPGRHPRGKSVPRKSRGTSPVSEISQENKKPMRYEAPSISPCPVYYSQSCGCGTCSTDESEEETLTKRNPQFPEADYCGGQHSRAPVTVMQCYEDSSHDDTKENNLTDHTSGVTLLGNVSKEKGGFLRLPKDPKLKAEILQSLKAAGIQYRIPNNK